MKKLSALATFAVLLAAPVLAQVASQPVSNVAAENFYGDIAKQIGGPDVIGDLLFNGVTPFALKEPPKPVAKHGNIPL